MDWSADAAKPINLPVPLVYPSVSEDGAQLAGACGDTIPSAQAEMCVVNLHSGALQRFSPLVATRETTSLDGVEISPDGRYVAYSTGHSNPYGRIQLYIHDLATNVDILITRLPGVNELAAWTPNTSRPCFLFHHYEEGGSSIYLSCLTPTIIYTKAIPYGEAALWFTE
jgi:Tol biopolymer transport system component